MLSHGFNIRVFIFLTLLLAFFVVVLGAYVRLSDAGLGCPDWPGCYGTLLVPQQDALIDKANAAFPDRPLQRDKAWKEMLHRYLAGILGLFILLIAVAALTGRLQSARARLLALVALVLVILQALLGMWTVTLLLAPVIVVAHLLGGFTILSVVYWLMLCELAGRNKDICANVRSLSSWAFIGILVMLLQITLGGWTSSNYAALVCPDIPACRGQWWPEMDFASAFNLNYRSGIDYEGGVLSADARTAIHVSHRIGALLTLMVIASIALKLIMQQHPILQRIGIVMLILLVLQLSLGVANVLMRLPLFIAVAHNGTAALLLLSMVNLFHHTRPIEQ